MPLSSVMANSNTSSLLLNASNSQQSSAVLDCQMPSFQDQTYDASMHPQSMQLLQASMLRQLPDNNRYTAPSAAAPAYQA